MSRAAFLAYDGIWEVRQVWVFDGVGGGEWLVDQCKARTLAKLRAEASGLRA